MAELTLNEQTNDKSEKFISKMDSKMYYDSEISSNAMTFDWVDEIEFSLPYIDNLIRNPKVALIKEEDVVKIEKAKKISVASVKDLAKNTHYIETIDKVTNDVKPSKILIERSEETFNTYENRFLYTLIDRLTRFMIKKERLLDDFKLKDDKSLEYAATTTIGVEKVNIELKMAVNEIKAKDDSQIEKELNEIRKKIEIINKFLMNWKGSDVLTALEKARVPLVSPPIRKTNLILKNPNFQVVTKLWNFLQTYDDDDTQNKDTGDDYGTKLLQGLMDDAFLTNYLVLDCLTAKTKKERKEKLNENAMVMLNQQIGRIVSILLENGVKMSDQDILDMIANGIKQEKNKKEANSADVKNKFKSAFDEYLEKTKNYL